MRSVHIIGGGVIGLCTAFYLQKAGYKVAVFDNGDITSGCSFGNMGYVSPSHFIPLASPGIISQGLKWMMSSSSPFYIKPRLNLDLMRWGIAFWKNSNARQVEKGTADLNALLQLSRHETNRIRDEIGNTFDMIEKGCWMLYKNERTGDHEKHLAEQAEALGLKTVVCNASQVQAYETEVEVDVKGGILYLDDCHINTGKFMRSMFENLRSAGVQFYLNTNVQKFEVDKGRVVAIHTGSFRLDSDEVIIANGSWMPSAGKKLGIHLLMQPGKGYSVVYDDLPKNLQYPSILVDDRTATTPIGKWLRIGGTMELSGHSDNILPKRVMAIYRAFKKYYPTMPLPQPDVEQAWYGYRPVTPDGLPYIGPSPRHKNVWFAGGHAMLGVSAAAGTGRLIEEMLSGKKTTIPVDGFRVDRFGN